MDNIVCPPSLAVGGEGLNFLPNFQKREGGLERTSTLTGSFLEKRGVIFFRGGGVLQFCKKTKNLTKSL